jgi:hypothetical protein
VRPLPRSGRRCLSCPADPAGRGAGRGSGAGFQPFPPLAHLGKQVVRAECGDREEGHKPDNMNGVAHGSPTIVGAVPVASLFSALAGSRFFRMIGIGTIPPPRSRLKFTSPPPLRSRPLSAKLARQCGATVPPRFGREGPRGRTHWSPPWRTWRAWPGRRRRGGGPGRSHRRGRRRGETIGGRPVPGVSCHRTRAPVVGAPPGAAQGPRHPAAARRARASR